jgi:hypothetical protein
MEWMERIPLFLFLIFYIFFVHNFISLTNSIEKLFGSKRGLQTKLFSAPSTSRSPVQNLALRNNCRCSSQLKRKKIKLDTNEGDSSHPLHH